MTDTSGQRFDGSGFDRPPDDAATIAAGSRAPVETVVADRDADAVGAAEAPPARSGSAGDSPSDAQQVSGRSAAEPGRPGNGGPAIRRGVLLMLVVCLAVGVVQGLVWAFTAPGIPYQVLADGRFGALPTTSTYHFVGVAAFALSGIAIGIVLAVGAWQFRSVRGWQMLLALVGGSLLGSVLAWLLGAWVAPGTDPASVGATAAGSIVTAPPTTGTILVVLAQPAFAAAVYTFLVAWNGHPDLGRSAVDDPGRATVSAETQ